MKHGSAAKQHPSPEPVADGSERRDTSGQPPTGARGQFVRYLCDLYRDWEEDQDWSSEASE
jgi:hypothetical protein